MEQDTQQKEKQPLSVAHAIIINAIIIGCAIILSVFLAVHFLTAPSAKINATAASSETPAVAVAPSPMVTIEDINLGLDPFYGNSKPKAVLAYWCDYQSPDCKTFETTTFQSILAKYVDGDNTVAVVFKDLPQLGVDSNTDALYGHAVWALYPGQYLAWREAMFASQDGVNKGFGDEASVVKLTGTISGIDAAKVQEDVAANKDAYQKIINGDLAEAATFNIKENPSFVTGKQFFAGPTPYIALSSALDSQLAGN